jgi:hypothetical protein
LRCFREGFFEVLPSDANAGLCLLEATSYTFTPLRALVARREVVGGSTPDAREVISSLFLSSPRLSY